jgi:hypothetical protein
MPDLNDAPRALAVLERELLDTKRLEAEVARAILAKAKSNAARRPTPQARMVASGMVARRGVVIGFASRRVFGSGSGEPVKLGHLAYGSEFGSNTHRQFGPRRESGYWLHPAAEGENRDIDEAEDDYLDHAIDAAIRSAGP